MPALLLAAGLIVTPGGSQAQVEVQRRSFLMGTTCTVRLEATERATGLAAIEAAFAAIARVEARLSTWRTDTALAGLNRTTVGVPIALDPQMFELLRRVRDLSRESGDAFDPAVGRLLLAWDVRGAGRTPGAAELQRARAASGMALVRFDRGAGSVTRLAPGPLLDAGGFGKGEGLARAARALTLAEVRCFSIDFGGQVLISPGCRDQLVTVADPSRRHRAVGSLRLQGACVATSSQNERPGHIIDPRSGRPAQDFGSVTVISTDPLRADAISTALFVLGPDQGLALAERLPDLDALFLIRTADGLHVRMTDGMRDHVVRLDAARPRTPADVVPPEERSGPGTRASHSDGAPERPTTVSDDPARNPTIPMDKETE